MTTEGYNGIRKKKQWRVTALTEIDVVDEYRRAFGVYQLVQCMMAKPEVGKSYHILTGGAVDLLAHVQWLMLHWRMKRIFISAWAISGADILLLEKMHAEGKFETVEVLVGDIFPSKYKMEWQKLTELEDRGVVNAVFKSTIHSKLLLMEAMDGTKVVVESSANCNMNPRVEQSCVTVSDKLFDFYWVYLHDMFEEDQVRATVRAEVEEMKQEMASRQGYEAHQIEMSATNTILSNETRNTDIAKGLTLFGENELGA